MISCPIHKNGNPISINFNNSKKYYGIGKVEACRCDKCKKNYIYVENMDYGPICKTSDGYEVVNRYKHIFLPKQIYIVDKKKLNTLKRKKSVISVITFFDNNYNKYQFLAEYDKKTNKYYISKDTYKTDYEILKKLKIKFIRGDAKTKADFCEHPPFPKEFHVLSKKDLKDLERNKTLKDINEFSDKNSKTHQVPSKYDEESEIYYITSGTYKNCSMMLKELGIEFIGPSFDENTKTLKSEETQESIVEIISESKIDLEELKQNTRVAYAYNSANILYNPYQYLPWLYMFNENEKNILISDEVGLGKTIEAGILIIEQIHNNPTSKILIVCPAFLRNKWKQELKEKFYLDASIFNEQEEETQILIVPLSRLKKFYEMDCSSFSMIIVDEVHYFKNKKSVRYKYLKEVILCNQSSYKIFMSATPINNTDEDYLSIKQLLGNRFVKTSTTKRQAYIHIKKRNIHEVYVDLNANEQEVYDVTDNLDPFSGTIYRHIGASCLYALKKYAEKYSSNESAVKEELKNSLEELLGSDYDEMEEIQSFNNELSNHSLNAYDSKLKKLMELIDEVEDKKIVIFSHYIETIKYLKSELSSKYNCEYIYSNSFSNHTILTNKKNRFLDAKKWFQQQDLNHKTILICSDSCKEGIDLDEASCLINYDLPFNPSILEQRIGRIDRMCQKQNMTIYNFHVNQTYDDRLHMILSLKLQIIDYYSQYGVGNPLEIVEDGKSPFDKFISYFKKNNCPMTNDDMSVIKKIMKELNVSLKKEITQEEVLDILVSNKENIIKLFDDNDMDELTDEQLYVQKELLDKKLGFPKHNAGRLHIGDSAKKNIVFTLNKNSFLKSRLSCIIENYEQKLKIVEDTGNPMCIDDGDIISDVSFDTKLENDSIFISEEIIKILEEQGAEIYANNGSL